MRIKMSALGLAALAMFAGQTARAATTVDGSITVTPVAVVSLTLTTTFYAFGSVDVNTSTKSITSLALNNIGTVGATVQKNIVTEASGWTAQAAAGADQYVLYAAASVSASAPGDAGFSNAASKFAAGLALNNLTNTGGAVQTTLAATSGTTNLWYKLDMPTTSATQAARMITVRYTGTAQ